MRFRLALAFALGALALPAPAMADWPVYGHDLSNTRDAGGDGPAPGDVGSMSAAWTFNSPNDFTGTPVVAGGVLVAGDYGGHVYGLDAVTGKALWTRNVGAAVNGSAAIDLKAPGGPTAFVPVAQVDSPRLVAISLRDGSKRWDAVLTRQTGASVFGSPTFRGGVLYIGTSGQNEDQGRPRGSVVALDEATGRIRWQTFTVPPGHDGAAVWSTPAIDPATDRLYVGTGNNYHEPTTDTEDAVLALDAASGRIVAKFQATANDAFGPDNPAGPDMDFGASPNLLDGPQGQPLVGEGQKSGTYWALDRSTLTPLWSRTVGPSSDLGGLLGSTAYDGTRIYGDDTVSGQVFALGRDGSLPWESADAGGLHVSPVSVAHGVLYTVDDSGFLTARDPATGLVLGKFPLSGPAFGGVTAVGGAVYVAVGTGPPLEPAPQQDGAGTIVAFGDTSRSGGPVAGSRHPGSRARGGRIKLSVAPRRVRAGRGTRIRVHVTSGSRPLARARVRVGRRLVRTNAGGRATVALRFHRVGRHVIRASGPGARTRATIRVVRRRSR